MTSKSPCVRNCCLDDHDICLGCGRSLEEIRAWSLLTPEQQQEVLLRAKERMLSSKAKRLPPHQGLGDSRAL